MTEKGFTQTISLQSLISHLLRLLRSIIDVSAKWTVRTIDKCGSNGYFLYGIIGNILYYISSLVIRNYPQIDWSVNLMMRGIMTWIFSYILTCTHNVSLQFPGNEMKYISIRNVILGGHQLFFFYVITKIPNKIVWVIQNVGPVFAFFVSYFLLRTKLTCKDIAYLLLSLLGVNLITAPQLILQLLGIDTTIATVAVTTTTEVNQSHSIVDFATSLFEVSQEMDSSQKLVTLIYFFSQIFWAIAIVIAKLSPTATSITINHNLGFNLMLFGAIAFISRADVIALPTFSDLLFDIVFMAVPAFVSQIFFIQGTIVAKDPGLYSLTNYICVFISYLMQFIYTTKIPTIFEIIGVIFAFTGVYKVVSKPKSPQTQQQQISPNSSNHCIQTSTQKNGINEPINNNNNNLQNKILEEADEEEEECSPTLNSHRKINQSSVK